MQSDREFMLQQVKQKGYALKYADESLKKDREIVLEAVKQYGWALQYADESLKTDSEIVLEAVKQNKGVVLVVEKEIGKELMLDIVKILGKPLESVSKDREFMLQQVKQDGYALKYADESLKKDRDFVLEAVKQYGWALQYADESLKTDSEIVLQAVKQNVYALQLTNESVLKDREIVLEAVKQDGDVLAYANESFLKDREIVLEAVKQNGFALSYVNESFKKDREIVLEAVKQKGDALQFANESLKKDREIVLEAVKQNGNALQYANDSFLKDREIVLEAVKQNGDALVHANELLKKDILFVFSLFKLDSTKARDFSPSLTKQIENQQVFKLSNSNIIEQYSKSFIDENDLYYCIELGSIFKPKTKSTIFNFNPTYSSIFVAKLVIFQILKQLNQGAENSFCDTPNYYLFCFRLEKFLEDINVQPTTLRELNIYVEKVVSNFFMENFEGNLYTKRERKEIMNFANKWLEDWKTFNNYKLILSKYNELRGDLSKVFKALKYSYNYFKNDYDFISILGNGGEGVVFKVFHKESESIRALKLKYDPEESVESGNQTIGLLKRNEIEGKIKYFDCGIIQNHLYSVMEIGEESLSTYITRNNENGIYGNEFIRKDKLSEIIEIFIRILHSVQSIHDNNILHRDLDPNNIVKVKENYKIIDFETSRVVKTGNSITIARGKYSYMSPEVSHDNYSDDDFKNGDNDRLAHNVGSITTSCDIFSLGCIFLKLLTNCLLQLDQQFINDSDVSKYGDSYLYFPAYGKYFYTVVTTIEGEMKLHHAIEKLINHSINPDLGVNNILIRIIITMIQRDSTKRLDCYSHKLILENVLKYLKGEIQDVTLNITKEVSRLKQITPLRSYSNLITENTNISTENTKLIEENNNLLNENNQLVEKVANIISEKNNLSNENNYLLERIKLLEQELEANKDQQPQSYLKSLLNFFQEKK